MGLISWIKDTYYNHKLDNADSAYNSKNINEAEKIYLEILDKQPKAAEHLAKMYFELAISKNDELKYYGKIKSLLSKASFGKDKVTAYLTRLILHIEKVAEQCFNNRDYNKASKYLKSIELDKRGDSQFTKRNRLYALYVNLNAIEFESSYASVLSLIDTYCKKNVEKDIEEAIISTSKRLRKSKKFDRAYCMSNCLAKKGNKNAIKECIATAYEIYKYGKASDKNVIDEDVLLDYISTNNVTNLLIGMELFAPFTAKYRKKYLSIGISVISSEKDIDKAFSTFKSVWENTPDDSLIKIFANPSSNIACLVFDYFANNIESLVTKTTYFNTLIKELSLFEDYNYVLDTLEKYKAKGLDTKEVYITKAKCIFEGLDENSRLLLIDKVILNYPDNMWAINEKMSYSEKIQARKNYAVAIQLYKELIGFHADAELRLAQLYFEQSQSELDFSKKRDLIKQAYVFKKKHNDLFNSEEYDKLEPHLMASVIDLMKGYFDNNDPDESYNTAVIFKTYVRDCLAKYIKKLKQFDNVTYILAKLEALKNEDIDVESDYKEIVNKIMSSVDYEDKYKLNILSKAIKLYSDDTLTKLFIQTAIEVIKQESEDSEIITIFGKTWNQLADAKLVVVFVDQQYSHHTSIVDYLIEETSVSCWKKELISIFCDQLFEFDNYKYSLSVFDRLTAKGVDVQKSYVASVLKVLPSLSDYDKLSLVNESLAKYNNEYLINEKLILSDTFKMYDNKEQAFAILNELVGFHAYAEPKLAQLYYEQSLGEIDFFKKRELVKLAYNFKIKHNDLFDLKEYDKLIPHLSASVVELIKDCFAKNNPDEAYNTAVIFKSFISECFVKYIEELKAFNDVSYILSKLETLKNEGVDVESDYKDIVNRIISTADYEDKYKLMVLSKTIELFSDVALSELFILTAIGVIKQESEDSEIISIFGKTWRQMADAKLLVVFVNQEYNHHTSIVDYLIENTSVTCWKEDLISIFSNQLLSFNNYKYSLSVFDRLTAKGIDVQKYYVASVLKTLPLLGNNDKLSLVNESLAKYPDEYLIKEKLNLSEAFANERNIETAESILRDLIGSHEMAEPRLAMLYYEEYKKNKDLDTKLELIRKGLVYHISHSSLFASDVYSSIFKKLLFAYTTLIDKFYSNNECDKAYKLCIDLQNYSDKWYIKYVKIRTDAIAKIEAYEDKIVYLKETFSILETGGISVVKNNTAEINNLWDILSEAEICFAKSQSYKDCVQNLNNYSQYISNHCFEEKANVLVKGIKSELIAIHRTQAYKYEQDRFYSDAIASYETLLTISDIQTKSWCRIRCLLSNIKDGKSVSEYEVRRVLSYVGFDIEKRDLAYRYALYLIKNAGAKESLSFVLEFLPDEDELISACYNEYVKEAELLLDELNQIIERFKNGLASLSEAKNLADRLNEYDQKLSPYLTGVHERIIALQPSVRSYILSKCYEEGDYEQALKYLKDTGKNWYEDNVYFRNVAIACLGIVESGKLNKSNYKAIISCWLTAVYCDLLFVKSLDYTSWDDSCTFTLKNSLGGSKDDSFKSLPDNVNFEEPIEGAVISIAEVQQNLLNRFEMVLNDKDEIFRDFYDEQKDAMDSFVMLNMDEPCIIAAPYIANNTRKCLNEIKRTLDYEYNNYGSENILKVAVLYGINTGIFKKYKDAIDYVDSCVSATKSMTVTKVRSAFIDSSIDSIKEFSELYNSFITEIQDILSGEIKCGSSYKIVLNVFSIICKSIKDSALSYIFGNYINQSIVAKLNDKSLDLAIGLKELVSAYNVAKSCTQLKNNIGNVMEALVGRYITEANPSDFATIKSVLSSTGTVFESNVANILTEEIILIAIATEHSETIENLTSISAKTVALRNKLISLKEKTKEISLNMELSKVVEEVNNNKMSYSSALQKVYSLYKDNKDHSRVCDNLCTLIGMCIREYVIPDKYGKSTVMSIFNELKYNKSATYKVSAQTLKNERQDILNSLPLEARKLLTGGTTYGSTLNEEGIKLKSALQLYLDLA